jgi:hypothetical protein
MNPISISTLRRLSLLALMSAGAAQAGVVSLANLSWNGVGAAGLIGGGSTVPTSPTGNAQFTFVSTADGVLGVSPLLLKTDGKGSEESENGSTLTSSAFDASKNDTLELLFNYVSTDGRGFDDYAWARLIDDTTGQTAAWLFTARSTNSARGHVVPGDVLKRQQDNSLPDQLDAALNNGNSVGFNVSSTAWGPLGSSSGYCWDSANTCGPSGWIESDYSIEADGRYRLEVGVVNWGDEAYDSALAFDFSGVRQANFNRVQVVDGDGSTSTVPAPATPPLLLAGLGLLAGFSRLGRAAVRR